MKKDMKTFEEKSQSEEWGGWKIVSDMLDKPDPIGIYPTGECYEKLHDFVVEQKEKARQEGYERGFDAGGKTVGGTRRVMYQQGYKEAEQEMLKKIVKEIRETIIWQISDDKERKHFDEQLDLLSSLLLIDNKKQ